MSRFAEAFTAELTRDVKVKRMPRLSVDLMQQPQSPMSLAKGVRIAATFEHVAWIQDTPPRGTPEGQLIAEAMKDVRCAIVEDVFGEFRPLILEMRTALYNADDTRMRSLLAEMEQRMFVEGL